MPSVEDSVLLAWLWPSAALLVWVLLLTFAGPRIWRWVLAQARATSALDAGALAKMSRVVAAGAVVLGLWLWIHRVPLDDAVKAFVTDTLEPWVWSSLALVLWLTLGFVLVRRFVAWADERAASSPTGLDDALLSAIRGPLHVLVVVAGVNMWAGLVPLPARMPAWIAVGTKGTAIVLVAMFANGFVQAWLRSRERASNVLATSGGVIRTGVMVLLYTIAFLMVLGTVGVDVTPIIASLGIGSLAIGLALQKTLEDFLAGLLIAADQPVHVGDAVCLASEAVEGVVVGIGWRTARLRTRDDTVVVLPNAKLAQATLINRSRPTKQLLFTVPVGVAYDSDLPRAAAAALDVAQDLLASHPSAFAGYDAKVAYTGFGASSIDLVVWLAAKDWERHFSLKDAFIQQLKRRFDVEGISIPFPMRTLDVPEGTKVLVERTGSTPRSSGSLSGGDAA